MSCISSWDDHQLLFELAWTLLSQRRYQEAADAFIRVTEINSWCVTWTLPFNTVTDKTSTDNRSHATYYFIAAGCYVSLHNYEKAHELFEKIPQLIDKKKIGGKDLPTEVFIKKKCK